ncbi:metal ABC transporter ATP-binding protein [uncultured Actinomyces sp.]|uniref:metal ABC transporter ATP-binding protein n=1 Tax=uncultured Actinomyces sp. TaxID=249061 RepID=UPI000ACB9CB5|nr:metal ABC transporter ATP-binding protein [uncultured Actinomyces sp.]
MTPLKPVATRVRPVVLSVSDVNVSFGNQQVLQDVSFSINRGELVGLLGPNGAGKTTLIRTILGLLRPDSGTIATAGPNTLVVEPSKPASKTPALAEASFKRGGCAIGYVPQKQEARWEYPITVEEVVISSLKPRFLAGAKHWRAAYEALDAVGMKEFRSRPISALSGGQRQRVLIARALAPKPSILLLDEPFTGLDEPNQEALAKMAMELTNKGISILMSTHDLVQAAGMCDRFILLNRTVRATGPLQNVAAPELWASTYEVSENAALVRAVQSLTEVEVGA